MNNDSQKKPINGLELFGDLDRFQSVLRSRTVGLPPSPAKEMIESGLTALGPLLANLKREYPEMLKAFHRQRDLVESKIATATQDVSQAKATMEKLPPMEEIKRNIVPAAPAIPTGLSSSFADEMRHRYLAATTNDGDSLLPGTAWQDWAIER